MYLTIALYVATVFVISSWAFGFFQLYIWVTLYIDDRTEEYINHPKRYEMGDAIDIDLAGWLILLPIVLGLSALAWPVSVPFIVGIFVVEHLRTIRRLQKDQK